MSGKSLRLLIAHQNFPGQFRRMADAWSKQAGWDILGVGSRSAPGMPSVRWLAYEMHRKVHPQQHHYLRQMEDAVLHGQAVARGLLRLKRKGYCPDVVLAHPGWGETLYIKEIFPNAKLIHLCEWYYATAGGDSDFDPEFPNSFDSFARLRTWNALHSLNLVQADVCIAPTQWQLSRHPALFHDKMRVVHEGVNTQWMCPDLNANLTLPSGLQLKAGDPVITYVARNLEPYRGFHTFMRALPLIQKAHATCHVLIVGGDEVSYGSKPADAANWREKMLAEVKDLDASRIHFLGKVPYDFYRKILQVSAAHVYLTYPFVLSWSMLEAMSAGCLVIGSNTSPVQEVIEQGRNGLLVDFFDTQALAQTAIHALRNQDSLLPVRNAARQTVCEKYDAKDGQRKYEEIILGS